MSDNVLTWAELEGSGGFPMLIQSQLQGSSSSHSHEFFELVYVEDGFCLHFSGSQVGLLMAGDLIALTPGQSHYYRCRNHVDIRNILFLPEALDGLMEEVGQLPGMADFFGGGPGELLHSHLTLPDRERLQRIITDVQEERQGRHPGWELRTKAALADLMVLLSRVFGARFPRQQSSNPYLGYVMSAISLMEEGYRDGILVGDIANQLGISPDHLTRQFRQLTGTTPTEYLRRYRFARALELLRQQKPVQEVCAATGFKQISHFSREFKAQFNMTPTAFQRQVREQY